MSFNLVSRGKRNYKLRRSKFKGSRMIPAQNRGNYLMRRGVARSMIGFKPAPHMFKRFTQNVWQESGTASISGISNTNGTAFNQFNIQFRLSDLPNSAEITALYDQFMITKVVIKFIPYRDKAELSNTAASTALGGGRLFTVIDNDDSTNISADACREYSSLKITDYGKVHKRVLTPAVLRQMYESTISSAYTPCFKQWLSTSDPTTIHYGLKGGLVVNDASAVTASIQYSIEAMYYFKCKNVK